MGIIDKDTLRVRVADPTDSQDIFAWRNDQTTREMSHTSGVVDWDTHNHWYESSLRNANRCLLICYLGNGSIGNIDESAADEKVGMVRFDINGDTAVISINMAPMVRGQGLARPCLRQAIEFFQTKYTDVRRIDAQIKTINTASRKSFEGTGFKQTEVIDDIGHFALELESGID